MSGLRHNVVAPMPNLYRSTFVQDVALAPRPFEVGKRPARQTAEVQENAGTRRR